MSKTILVLSASPRKHGNSDILCDQFAQGAAQAGHAVEKIRVPDKAIALCTACEHCMTHHGQCIHDDDMADILDKMVAADVIVLATPVYFYSMNAQLKALIDRTVARYTEISGKEFYFIITAADGNKANMRMTIDGLRGFTMCLSGAEEKGIVYGLGAWKKGDIKTSDSMAQALEMGLNA